MAKISKKTVLISVIALLVLAGTNFITYSLTKPMQPDSVAFDSSATQTTDVNETFKSLSEESTGTVSILEISTRISDFVDKDITVQGLLTKSPDDTVLIVEPGDKAAAQILDISGVKEDDIAFNNFYKIQGKLILNDKKVAVLKVSSLEQINPN